MKALDRPEKAIRKARLEHWEAQYYLNPNSTKRDAKRTAARARRRVDRVLSTVLP